MRGFRQAFDLPPDLLKKREVVYIDIANDKVSANVTHFGFLVHQKMESINYRTVNTGLQTR